MEYDARCPCGGIASPLVQGGQHTASVFNNQISQVHVCGSCSHVFFFPRPTEQQLTEYYNGRWSEGSGYSIEFSHEAWISKIHLPIHKPKATFVETVCGMRKKYFKTGSRVALHDASCGNGALVSKLKLLDFDATGSDIDGKSIEQARSRGNSSVFHGHFADISRIVPDGVDILTCYHSLEHYPNPLDFFRSVKQVLRPEGLLIMAVPNGAYLPARVVYFGKYDWCFYPGHLQYFTPTSARVLLAKCGLRLIEASSHDWDGTQEDWLLNTAAQLPLFRSVPRHNLLQHLANCVLTRDLRIVAINKDEPDRSHSTLFGRAIRTLRDGRAAFLGRRPKIELPETQTTAEQLLSPAVCYASICEGIQVIGYELLRRDGQIVLSMRWVTNHTLPDDCLIVLHVRECEKKEDEFVNLDFPPYPPTKEWRPLQEVKVFRNLVHPRTTKWLADKAINQTYEPSLAPGKYYMRVGLWDLKQGLLGDLATLGPVILPID